jgi:hypothetical protein
MRALIQELQELCLLIVGWIMRLAPFGLAALLLQLVATQNVTLLASLAHFIAVVVGTTLFHGIVILPLLLWLVTRMSPLHFWKGARDALITAFATSSSAATLPVTLRCAEQHLHVKKDIANFVVPLGATMNMDGTALYEAAAALFVARLAGIELDLAHQLIIFFVAMLGAIGAPGIPSVGMLSDGPRPRIGRPAHRRHRHPAPDRPHPRHRAHGGQCRRRHGGQPDRSEADGSGPRPGTLSPRHLKSRPADQRRATNSTGVCVLWPPPLSSTTCNSPTRSTAR